MIVCPVFISVSWFFFLFDITLLVKLSSCMLVLILLFSSLSCLLFHLFFVFSWIFSSCDYFFVCYFGTFLQPLLAQGKSLTPYALPARPSELYQHPGHFAYFWILPFCLHLYCLPSLTASLQIIKDFISISLSVSCVLQPRLFQFFR